MFPAVLALYLLALVALGARKARGVRTQEDFALAGRGLSGVVLCGTLLATWIGTGSIFGNAQKGYEDGLAAFVLPLSSAAGIVVLFLLASRLRRMEHVTVQDILDARFGVVVRVAGTLTLLAGYLVIVSYQYRAGAAVLERVVPGLAGPAAVAAVALFVVVYTALAGMLSVAYTDLANGVLMVLGLGAALAWTLHHAGGPAAVLEQLEPAQRDPWHYGPAKVVSYLLPAFLLILGDANMYQRFFSARDPLTARRAAAGMFFGVLLLDWMIVGLAVCAAALVHRGELSAPANSGHTIVHLAFEALPAGLGAVLCATVLAVVVSTADSYLLSPASAVVRDLYQRFLRPQADGRELVRASRWVVALLGAAALGLAFTSERFFEVALFAYTLYGAAITPPLLAALFWKRATTAGALASMVVGLGSAVAWHVGLGARLAEALRAGGHAQAAAFVGDLDAALPAVLVSLAALVLVSLLGAPRVTTPAAGTRRA
ncbi:MAG: sodium:solute symporter family protein [Planctomycetes bacterium]|nr:sodium:solute symporter family protein [Planctomycetota bacterium]